MMRFVIEVPDGDFAQQFRLFETTVCTRFVIQKMYGEVIIRKDLICGGELI